MFDYVIAFSGRVLRKLLKFSSLMPAALADKHNAVFSSWTHQKSGILVALGVSQPLVFELKVGPVKWLPGPWGEAGDVVDSIGTLATDSRL